MADAEPDDELDIFIPISELEPLGPAGEEAWIVQGLLARGQVTLLGAKAKDGKSTFVGGMLAAVERGEPFAGLRTRKATAVLVSEEPREVLIARGARFRLEHLAVVPRDLVPGDVDFATLVQMACEKARELGAEIIVIDPLGFLGRLAAEAENDAGAVRAVLEPLFEAARHGFAVLAVHHFNKRGEDSFRGSSALEAGPDTLVRLVHEKGLSRRQRRIWTVGRSDGLEMVIELEEDGYRLVSFGAERSEADLAERMLGFLGRQGTTADEWIERTKIQRKAGLRGIRLLVDARQIREEGGGVRGDPHLYSRVGTAGADPLPLKDIPALRSASVPDGEAADSVPPLRGGEPNPACPPIPEPSPTESQEGEAEEEP